MLVVDADPGERSLLAQRVQARAAGARVHEAGTVADALACADPVDLVLIDCHPPDTSLQNAMAMLSERWPRAPRVAVANRHDTESIQAALGCGAISLLLKQADDSVVRATVDGALAGHGLVDLEVVGSVISRLASALDAARFRDVAVIESLAAAVEAKDAVTGRHLQGVSQLARQLARLVDPEMARSEEFMFGCLLHDIGKIGVPERILCKPGPLTDEEWTVMRRHPETGERVIRPLGLEDMTHDIVLHHHERWDGGGYPGGLSGEEIPLVARVFAVCDALDAMTSGRPYREPMSAPIAIERVRIDAGEQFDPAVVEALNEGLATGQIEVGTDLGVAGLGTLPTRRITHTSRGLSGGGGED